VRSEGNIFFLFVQIVIRKLIHYISYWLLCGWYIIHLEKIQRSNLVESIEFPSHFQSARRWWCEEWLHKGVWMFCESSAMSSSFCLEDIAYRGNTQISMEGNMSLKNPVKRPGIDPGTVRIVAQRNHYATTGPT
jgi:hypothetical protein